MKKSILFLSACFIFLTGGQAIAQQKKPAPATKPVEKTVPAKGNSITPEQRAEQITNSMAKNLALNSAQLVKVRQINLQSVKQMEAAKVKHQKNPRAMVNEADLISQSRLARLKDVLSAEQFNKYQRKREQEMGVSEPANPATPKSPESQSYGE